MQNGSPFGVPNAGMFLVPPVGVPSYGANVVARPFCIPAAQFNRPQLMRPPLSQPSIVQPLVMPAPLARIAPHSTRTATKAPLSNQLATPSVMTIPTVPVFTVYIGRIPPKCEDEFLKKLLEKCGTMSKWTRISDPVSGQLKSFGFCDFVAPESALRALRLLKDVKIDDEQLLLNVDNKTKKMLDEYTQKNLISLTNNMPINEGDDIVMNQINILLKERRYQEEETHASNESKHEIVERIDMLQDVSQNIKRSKTHDLTHDLTQESQKKEPDVIILDEDEGHDEVIELDKCTEEVQRKSNDVTMKKKHEESDSSDKEKSNSTKTKKTFEF